MGCNSSTATGKHLAIDKSDSPLHLELLRRPADILGHQQDQGEFRNGKFLIGWIDKASVGTDRVTFYNGANPIDQYVSAIDDGTSQNTASNWVINTNMSIEVGWITGQARFIQAGADQTGSPITDEDKIPDINLPVGLAFYDGGGCVFDYIYVCDWVDPAPTVAFLPTVTGATSCVSEPINAPSLITVLCL